MKNLPKMISTKDAAYLADMFNWNMVAAQKYRYYTSLTTDKEITKKIEDLVNMHISFCETIVDLLERGQENEG